VARAHCDSWACDDCRQRMAERWSLRAAIGASEILRRGELLDFVTITSHEKLRDFAATEAVWRKAWEPLYHALKRQKVDFQYMIVPERHKDGRMHVHALWNAGVSQKWLKDNARKRGLGYQCKVINVTHQGYAQKYIVKYVGKSLGDFSASHFRRVRVSHTWADVPTPNTALNGLRWEYIGTNGALATVYDECRDKRISLIDVETGELFDDINLGTIYA
jgi:hypothetical protein